VQHHHCGFNRKKHLDFIISSDKELSFGIQFPLKGNWTKYQHTDCGLVEIDDHITMRLLDSKYFSSFKQRLQILFGKLLVEMVVVAQILNEMCLCDVLYQHFCHLLLVYSALPVLLRHTWLIRLKVVLVHALPMSLHFIDFIIINSWMFWSITIKKQRLLPKAMERNNLEYR